MKSFSTGLERLEDRIAPSTLAFVSPQSATYTDVDGDKVTVHFSKPFLSSTNVSTVLLTSPTGLGDQLTEIDLTSVAGAAKGTSITVSAVPTATAGDGVVNVGEIVATGINLGMVTVKGDLGLILAGADSGTGDVALKGLTVGSLGVFGGTTGATPTSLGNAQIDQTMLAGSAGPIVIHGDATDINLILTSSLMTTPAYSYASVTIGGTFSGASTAVSEIYTQNGSIGPVKVGGSLISAPIITSKGNLASITIGGDVSGASTELYTGSGSIGPVKIGGSILNSLLIGDGPVASLTVGGSVAGLDLYSEAAGKIGPVKIAGALASAFIGDGPIASVTVGGSVTGLDLNNSSGSVGPIKIGGSLTGGSTITSTSGSLSSISVVGDLTATIQSELGIGSVKVGGSVSGTNILVGYTSTGVYTKSVQLGSLQVGGDWIASDVAVGARNLGSDDAVGGTGSAADNVNFGNADDQLFTAAGSTAKILSVSISGEVLGTPDSVSNTDSFAFLAGQIESFKVGGIALPLKSGPDNDDRPLGLTGDVVLKEL